MNDLTLLDGGTGRELQHRGLVKRGSIWSALALRERPDVVGDIHESFIKAGADVITVNNYSVVPALLALEGMEGEFESLIHLAGDLAKRARDKCNSAVRVAGSLPPLNISYRHDLVGSEEDNIRTYRRIAEGLSQKVDLFLCETMSSGIEARAAVRAVADFGKPIWVAWSLGNNPDGRLLSGETIEEALLLLDGLPVDTFLFNCCPPESISAALPILRSLTERPIGAYANSFDVPRPERGETPLRQDITPDSYRDWVAGWIHAGAHVLGGCCGIGPAHIALLRDQFDRQSISNARTRGSSL